MKKRQTKKFRRRYHHRKWCRAHMATNLSNLAKEVAMMMSSKAYYTEKEDTAKKYVSYINDLLEGTPYMLLEDSVKINERGNLACEVVRKPTFTIDIDVGDNIRDDIIKEVGAPKDVLDTGAYDTYMTPSTTLLSDKLIEATEIIPDIPDDRILKYLDEGFNSSKDDIE